MIVPSARTSAPRVLSISVYYNKITRQPKFTPLTLTGDQERFPSLKFQESAEGSDTVFENRPHGLVKSFSESTDPSSTLIFYRGNVLDLLLCQENHYRIQQESLKTKKVVGMLTSTFFSTKKVMTIWVESTSSFDRYNSFVYPTV